MILLYCNLLSSGDSVLILITASGDNSTLHYGAITYLVTELKTIDNEAVSQCIWLHYEMIENTVLSKSDQTPCTSSSPLSLAIFLLESCFFVCHKSSCFRWLNCLPLGLLHPLPRMNRQFQLLDTCMMTVYLRGVYKQLGFLCLTD